MKYYTKVILGLIFLSIILSCSDDNIVELEKAERPISMMDMFKCHQQLEWDSLSITNELIGRWDWQFVGCFWTPENDNNTQYSDLSIQFNNDNTLNVINNGIAMQTSNWVVTHGDSPAYKIVTEPRVKNLDGRIWFCDDLLEFNNSYRDGCDNIFKKVK